MTLTSLLAVLVLAGGPAQAKYNYGKSSYGSGGGSEEAGVYFRIEGLMTNPRNTEAVVATSEVSGALTSEIRTLVPDWGDEFAGRLALGYVWSNGNSVYGSYWNFKAEQGAAGSAPDNGFLHFAIGPPVSQGDGTYLGHIGTPGSYDITTEVKASVADLGFAKIHSLADKFTLEWSIGLRQATYEETSTGTYSQAVGYVLPLVPHKSNKGEMIGAKLALRGRYMFISWLGIAGSFGYSALDGELTASSSLTSSALSFPESISEIKNDGRSGTIRDLDAVLVFAFMSDRLRITAGWEQSTWEGIASDLVRNFPGTTAPLRDRDSVVFSGYKLGVYFKF